MHFDEQMTLILQATHTHLYPGHRGKISGAARIADIGTGGDCLVEFADGSAAAGKMSKTTRDWRLQVGAYRTAAGTAIGGKYWAMRLDEVGDEVKFRVLAKTPAD